MKGFLRGLKLPVKLLARWLKRRKKRSELEEKCRKHVRNFAPTHYSWQKSGGKDKKKRKKGKFSKKKKGGGGLKTPICAKEVGTKKTSI